MGDLPSVCCTCAVLLIAFIFCLPRHVHTQKNVSCFSFIHTDTNSPMTLEDTCFEISDNRVNTMYTGIFLDVIKSSCKYYDMQLEDVKKYIVEESHQRPLCRIRMTMSIDTTQCTKTIAIIQHFCKQPKSIFFQDCFPVNCPSTNKKKINETEAISMSGFPKPKMGNIGQGVYEIPTSHCNMKQCKLDNCSTEEMKKRNTKNGINNAEPSRQKQCTFLAIGSAGGGLLVGILSTSFVCLLVNKCRRNYRNVGDVSFSTQNVFLLTETERKSSIHSKEGEPVYHDISHIPGHSKAKAIVHSVSNAFSDDQPEQRYSESPKSSSSVHENGSISSQLSPKNAERGSKESVNGEKAQVYHTLNRDYKDNSRNLDVFSCVMTVEKDPESYKKSETVLDTKSKHYSTYESPVQLSHLKRIQTDQAESIDFFDDRVEILQEVKITLEDSPQVYHTLQKEEEDYDAEKMAACTDSDQDIHDQSVDSNSDDSQKEYYVISTTSVTKQTNPLIDS
ncbi:uncharacterized protein LOC125654063 isoform X2 [Ostrea edulis]|uniref:uncharacterized protein LOC125654063 isoform X2 n=1 Tax=Ostrea edulis TaxID=37623 RepID=UPI0024AFBC93|nr:uncharacterized protein LOC125654063 isoform X2 [Ostrea edulis]